jgi:trehalose 6-phosphate phosphatase
LGVILQMLHDRLDGALALVSGRSLTDIDVIFAPLQFPAVGGHGAEMRLSVESEAVASRAPPMDNDLKRRFIAVSQLSPGILYEDKGYSIALHYRLAPQFERTIYEAVSAIVLTCRRRPLRFFLANSFARSSRLVSPKRRAFAN